VVSVTDPSGRILGFLEVAATFLSSSSSDVLRGPRSILTTVFFSLSLFFFFFSENLVVP
jgi:hypothetical protein